MTDDQLMLLFITLILVLGSAMGYALSLLFVHWLLVHYW
jgi:hypothetical protein